MARAIRIPLVADLILAEHPAEIRALADHRLLDRGFTPAGPLINRIVAGRARRALRLGGRPLPSAARRGDTARARGQAALAERLGPGGWDAPTVTALAGHLRGAGERPVGHLAQELCGRLFASDYRATEATWAAALLLDAYIRSWNPLRRLHWAFSQALRRAQRTLAEPVGEDLAGVHATGIAVHNLVESVNRMASDWREPRLRAALGPEAAAARALAGPEAVLRQAPAAGSTLAGGLRPGTLAVLRCRAAADRTLDADLAFLGSAWSRCPADRLVPALLAEIWRQATAEEARAA